VSGDVEKPGAGRGNNVEVDDFDRNNLNPFMAGPPQFTHLSMGGYNKAKWSLMTGLQLRVRVHRISHTAARWVGLLDGTWWLRRRREDSVPPIDRVHPSLPSGLYRAMMSAWMDPQEHRQRHRG
jgi:hypothetical protein